MKQRNALRPWITHPLRPRYSSPGGQEDQWSRSSSPVATLLGNSRVFKIQSIKQIRAAENEVNENSENTVDLN